MNTRMSIAVVAALLVWPLCSAAQVTMLKPIQPIYQLLGFVYKAPPGDGWRELEATTNLVRVTYAEDHGDGTIVMKMELTAEAHEVPANAGAVNVRSLALASFQQRRKEREARDDVVLRHVVELRLDRRHAAAADDGSAECESRHNFQVTWSCHEARQQSFVVKNLVFD